MLYKPILKVISIVVFLLAYSITALAQLGTATITGSVVDTTGAVINGAMITVKNTGTGQTREASTDEAGLFVIQTLPPAVYEIKIEADGFTSVVISGFQIRVGETGTVIGKLKAAIGEEIVEIKANEAQGVDTTTSQVTAFISASNIENLPLNGRNFLDLAFLLPGNTAGAVFDTSKPSGVQLSAGGQSGRGSTIAVDGGEQHDDEVGGSLQNFPQDAISEFQIITTLASADVGRTSTSAVNAVTKSGTNEFHGSAGFFFRNAGLSALPATLDRTVINQSGKPDFDREQYPGSIGGPIKKDKAWFFTAFEYRRQKAIAINGLRDTNAQRLITTFSETPLNDLLYLGRVDWQVAPKDRMAFRYAFERDEERTAGFATRPINSPDQRIGLTNTFHSFVYNYVHIFNEKMLNEFVFQESYFKNRIPTFVATTEVLFPSIATGGSSNVPTAQRNNRIQFRDNFSLLLNKHSLKFGAEIQRFNTRVFADIIPLGSVIALEDFPAFDRNQDGTVNDDDILTAVAIRSNPSGRDIPNQNYYFGFYAQDSWKVTSNFSLNYGLRYEYESNSNNSALPDNFNPLVTQFLSPGGREKIKTNFGPRVGFNYDPTRKGKTSIHGGYGIYYERIIGQLLDSEKRFNGSFLQSFVFPGSSFFTNPDGTFLPFAPLLSNPFVADFTTPSNIIGIFALENKLKNPMVQQFAFGIRQEILKDIVLSVDGVHEFGTRFPFARPTGPVFNPSTGSADTVFLFEPSGKTWYDALYVNVEKKLSHHYSFIASYTLSKAFNYRTDELTGFDNLPPVDPNNNIRLEKGFSVLDQRHKFTLASVIELPYGVTVSPIYTVASSLPFEILLPTGQRVPDLQRYAGARQFHNGRELNTFINRVNAGGGVAGFGLLPLVNDNLEFGDSFTSFDLRVSKTVKINEKFNIQGIVEAFNLFNVTNIRGSINSAFSGFQNVLVPDANDPTRSSTFGQKLQTAGGVFGTGGPRSFQFAVRVNF